MVLIGGSGTCHALRPHKPAAPLIGKHALERGLVGRVCHHALVQLLLSLVRLRGQNMTAKGMTANHFARARLLEPLGRTFVGLQLRHKRIPGLNRKRLTKYSTRQQRRAGECSRRRRTVWTIRPAAKSSSSSVLNRPKPNRTVPRAASGLNPRARSTWLGSGVAELQADPVDSATSGRLISSAAASTDSNVTFRLPASRCSSEPFTRTPSRPLCRLERSRSRNPRIRASSASISSKQIT